MDFSTLQGWSAGLGLLPFPLWSGADQGSKAVLLNGDRGNFCLDLSGEEPDADSRNASWSSNVGHYISITQGAVLVQRWDRPPSSLEFFRLHEIEADPEKFHEHLVSASPPTSASIVAHALRTFRQLRAVLGSEATGEHALEAFLTLLASVAEGLETANPNLDRWGLSANALDVAQTISGGDWEMLVSDLRDERPADRLRPSVRLLLRHAAGALFQEAHYLAAFPWGGQLQMEGIPRPQFSTTRDIGEKGVHFTPAPLARALVEASLAHVTAEGRDHLTVLDPACGSGEFLREAARQLRARGYTGTLELRGADRSPGACAMAKFLLSWEYHGTADTQFSIHCGDSLTDAECWPQSADIVLMNPPFVSWLDMSHGQQESVRAILGDLAGARPDMASAFLWKACQTIGNSGALGSVLPASTLDGTSYRALRAAVEGVFSLRLIARLGSHQIFPNARVDAGLLVVSRPPGAESPTALWADHRQESASRALRTLRRIGFDAVFHLPIEADGFSIYPVEPAEPEMSDWAPRPYRQQLLRRRMSSLPTVNDLFIVRQGVHTGRNDVFLVPEPELKLLPGAERQYFRPAVINGSVMGGRLSSRTFVFYPYGDKELASEDDLRAKLPHFYRDHLAEHRDELANRQRKSEADWWTLAEPRSWQVAIKPKIVSTYFGDVGSFAFDESGSHVVVQGYAWLPRNALGRSAALAYVAVLSSPTFSDLLAASSNNVGSGAWNLSKRYIAGIPIPAVEDSPRDVLDGLARLGQVIAAEGMSSLSVEHLRELAEFARAAYEA